MINVNYYIIIIWLTCWHTYRGTGATYVRTLALATYFKSVEHIKDFFTYINYRNLIDIYEEY